MTIRATIKNDEPATHPARLRVTVVTVGKPEAGEQHITLAGQEQAEVLVHKGQFVMVDESDKEPQ